MGKLDLSKSDRETWLHLSRDVAIRQGDRAALEALRDVPDSFGQDVIYTVLLAYGHLGKGDLKKAKATLDALGDMKGVNEREKRRADSIRARVAQLEVKPDEERKHVEKLVDHLAYWISAKCQSCHNSPQDPKAMTSLPVTNLWFGERYVELLRQQGDAEKVKAEAEAALKKSADDEEARVRLGFALKALKKDAEAEAEFRKLPWADFPGRDLKKPRMMTTFP